MLVVNRFRVDAAESSSFREALECAHLSLAACSGYQDGVVGRNVDDPGLWVLTTRWENVGSYRRALSSYDVKMNAVALLARALDEPSAYEVAAPHDELNRDVPRRTG